MVQNSYFCKNSYLNVYELASKKSNISTQLIYGEKFSIIGKKKGFFKIKTDFDNYLGFIKIEKFNKVLNKTINSKISVTMIHGQKDEVVPVVFSRYVLRLFTKAYKKLIIIKKGDHSLSAQKYLKKITNELSTVIKNVI